MILGIMGGPRVPGVANSIVDGKLVTQPPKTALRKGDWAKVPVIIGANDADLAVAPSQNKDDLFALAGPRAAEARALYDPKGDASLEQIIGTMLADRTMIEPARNVANLVAAGGQRAYLLRFSYVAESQRGKVPGATHGAEIAYAFDAAPLVLGKSATPSDIAIAAAMSGYWADFARSGDPNGGDRPKWPVNDPNVDRIIEFTNNGVVVGPDPFKPRLDFWKSIWDGRQ